MKGFSTEVKVGLLLLAALLLMGGFLFALGGINLKGGYSVYVDFDNPGGLKPGAAVRIAGVRVGTVEKSQYMGGRLDPKTNRRPLVRIELRIDEEVKDTIHEDALFYVTSSGVLGEPFMAIDPGSAVKPVLAEGSINRGLDPPRLDLALAMGYELLETMVEAVRNNKDEIAGLLHDTSGLLKGLNNVIGKNEQKFHNIIANVETASDEGTQLIKGVRTNYVDSPQIKRIVNNIDKTMQDTSPLVKDVRATVADVLGPEQREKLKSTISDASILADRAKVTLADAQAIMTHMKRGEGTVGGLLMDEEIYDDVQEMLRDIKHNPWKLFWRE